MRKFADRQRTDREQRTDTPITEATLIPMDCWVERANIFRISGNLSSKKEKKLNECFFTEILQILLIFDTVFVEIFGVFGTLIYN